jgi:hypothetical protein
MNKRRIHILSLAFVFLASTTGMPFFYHYCEMIGKRSLSECNTCAVEVEAIESSCCSEENSESNIAFTSQSSACCIDEFHYEKVEDVFSQSFNSNFSNLIVLNSISKPELLDSENEDKYVHYNKLNLPPPKFGKELLNSIHQLKIDTPIC